MITNWSFDITTFWHSCRDRTFPARGKTKALKRSSAYLWIYQEFQIFPIEKCQHMRIAMTGQPVSLLASAWRANAIQIHNPAKSAMARSPNQSQKAFRPKGCRHRRHGKATRRFHEIFNSFFLIYFVFLYF